MKSRILAAARFFESGGRQPELVSAPQADEHASSYYVAGIRNDEPGRSTQELTETVKQMIPRIMADAKQKCGEKAIVIIALCEYAMTFEAISLTEKNNSIAALQSVVNCYDNLILIPGSYAVVDRYIDANKREHKIIKMRENYKSMSQHPVVSADLNFRTENKRMSTAKLESSKFLQNCTYIMFANTKVKHKKSFPYFEHDKVKNMDIEDNRVFYIGADTPLKEVHACGKKIEAGISICRDIASPLHKEKLLECPPLLHVIVSSPLDHRTGYWYGALNVHIDSDRQLAVAINNDHYRRKEIKMVTGFLYHTNSTLYINSIDKEAVKIIEFREALQPKTPQDNYGRGAATSGCNISTDLRTTKSTI